MKIVNKVFGIIMCLTMVSSSWPTLLYADDVHKKTYENEINTRIHEYFELKY